MSSSSNTKQPSTTLSAMERFPSASNTRVHLLQNSSHEPCGMHRRTLFLSSVRHRHFDCTSGSTPHACFVLQRSNHRRMRAGEGFCSITLPAICICLRV